MTSLQSYSDARKSATKDFVHYGVELIRECVDRVNDKNTTAEDVAKLTGAAARLMEAIDRITMP